MKRRINLDLLNLVVWILVSLIAMGGVLATGYAVGLIWIASQTR